MVEPGKSSGLSPSTLVQNVTPTADRTRAVMTVLGGVQTGRMLSLSLGASVTLGRGEHCTHRIEEASVSGTHARIVALSAQYMLADEHSTNGTFVNGIRVTEPVILRDGDRVQLGPIVLLRFSLVSELEERALQTMYESAHRDALTGVFNRKHLDERLDTELAYAQRHQTELAIILIDVDFFKKVNDSHGHLAGDAVLRHIGALLARTVRTEDVVARYGGEEFVVVARDVPIGKACAVAERIRQTIEQAVLPFEGKELRVTASSGVATLQCCGERRDKATLLGLADRRLYRAKELGRNRVMGPV
jgi:two-component system cell cycle response regulator